MPHGLAGRPNAGRHRADRDSFRMALIGTAATIVLVMIALASIVIELVQPTPRQAALAVPLIDASSFPSSATEVSTSDRDEMPRLSPVIPPPPKSHIVKVGLRPAGDQTGLSGPPGEMGELGIPVMVLQAYQNAERILSINEPNCHLMWWMLAGIGHTESGHAEGGRVDANGTTRGRILGPVLDGHIPGTEIIKDTDHGVLDGDKKFDRAVGPMQFIPASWKGWGVDANGDGVADPNNIFDATAAAGYVLCNGNHDLRHPSQLKAAILSYNHSEAYYDTVIAWAVAYRHRAVAIDNSSLAIATEPSPAAKPAATVTHRKPTSKPTASSSRPSGSATATASSTAPAGGGLSLPPLPGASPSPSSSGSSTSAPGSSAGSSTSPSASPSSSGLGGLLGIGG